MRTPWLPALLALGIVTPDLARAADAAPQSPAHAAAVSASARAPATDTTPARQLLDTAEAQRRTDLRAARATAERALAAARQARHRADELRALSFLADTARRHGDYAASLRYGREGLAASTATRDSAGRAEFLYLLASSHRAIGDLPKALELLREALPLAEQANDRALLISVYGHLHLSSSPQTAPQARLEYIQKALEISESLGDETRIAVALNNLGNTYRERGDTARARATYERSLALKLKAGDKRSLAIAYHNLADIADDEGRHEDALDLMRQSHTLRREVGDTRGVAIALYNIANFLNRLGRPAEALVSLEEAVPIAQGLDAPQLQFNVQQVLSTTQAALGNYQAAWNAEQAARDARIKVLNEQSQQRLLELQTRLDVERKEREIDLLKRDQALQTAELQAKASALDAAADRAARHRSERNLVIGGLILSLLAAAALISRQQIKRRAAQRILAETQRARQAAEEADTLKTRLLHMASHDLKAPLGTIISIATTLRTAPAGAPPPAELAGWIEGESRRLFGFVNDLLDEAVVAAGRLELQRADCDFAALARDVVAALEIAAREKHQRITFRDDTAGAATLEADAARLRQVLENLLGNALKFTPRGGEVHVILSCHDDTLRCAIRDEGPGLTADELSRLFRRFERLSAQPTGSETSTGLGLSIAHDIVSLHGGKIRAESTPGAGATFILELPLATATVGATRR